MQKNTQTNYQLGRLNFLGVVSPQQVNVNSIPFYRLINILINTYHKSYSLTFSRNSNANSTIPTKMCVLLIAFEKCTQILFWKELTPSPKCWKVRTEFQLLQKRFSCLTISSVNSESDENWQRICHFNGWRCKYSFLFNVIYWHTSRIWPRYVPAAVSRGQKLCISSANQFSKHWILSLSLSSSFSLSISPSHILVLSIQCYHIFLLEH